MGGHWFAQHRTLSCFFALLTILLTAINMIYKIMFMAGIH